MEKNENKKTENEYKSSKNNNTTPLLIVFSVASTLLLGELHGRVFDYLWGLHIVPICSLAFIGFISLSFINKKSQTLENWQWWLSYIAVSILIIIYIIWVIKTADSIWVSLEGAAMFSIAIILWLMAFVSPPPKLSTSLQLLIYLLFGSGFVITSINNLQNANLTLGIALLLFGIASIQTGVTEYFWRIKKKKSKNSKLLVRVGMSFRGFLPATSALLFGEIVYSVLYPYGLSFRPAYILFSIMFVLIGVSDINKKTNNIFQIFSMLIGMIACFLLANNMAQLLQILDINAYQEFQIALYLESFSVILYILNRILAIIPLKEEWRRSSLTLLSGGLAMTSFGSGHIIISFAMQKLPLKQVILSRVFLVFGISILLIAIVWMAQNSNSFKKLYGYARISVRKDNTEI